MITGRIVAAATPLYCGVCHLPPEYCEFGSHASKCKTWLEDQHPQAYEKIYSDSAVEANLQALTVEQREALAKDSAKKEQKAAAKEQKQQAQLQAARVVIRKLERTKRKSTTSIQGLEQFGVDLKKAAKFFAQRFATGASVSKTAAGEEEIVIQGEVAEEVEELLLDTTPKIAAVLGEGRISEDQIAIVTEKKKKGAAAEA